MLARLKRIRSQPPWLLSEAPNLPSHPLAFKAALQEMAHNRLALCAGSVAAEKAQEKLLARVLECSWPKLGRRGSRRRPSLRHFPPD
jgi:hypothetical protein